MIDLAKTRKEAGMVGAMLKRRGLPTDIGEAIKVLARTIRDDKHLENLLTSTPPEDRNDLYESVKPHLRFIPKPLDVYVSRVGQRAEREKWPTLDADGRLHEFRSARDVSTVQKLIAAELAKRTLTLVCAKCLKQEVFHQVGEETNVDVILKARKAGWVHDYLSEPAREICPKCPTLLRDVNAGN
jgi:hypothetical protein